MWPFTLTPAEGVGMTGPMIGAELDSPAEEEDPEPDAVDILLCLRRSGSKGGNGGMTSPPIVLG